MYHILIDWNGKKTAKNSKNILKLIHYFWIQFSLQICIIKHPIQHAKYFFYNFYRKYISVTKSIEIGYREGLKICDFFYLKVSTYRVLLDFINSYLQICKCHACRLKLNKFCIFLIKQTYKIAFVTVLPIVLICSRPSVIHSSNIFLPPDI